ncbi:MAG TPA: nitrate reductase molybdenum cofactor assembly chaperone [Gammaproteobacteria bacterium]|nr:nitrate reductase molybdenum cofactor assembly chaperone [Gammaproteobacteria bacterium]
MKSYRALALLLRYPQPEWLEALDEVEALLHAERHRNRRALSRVAPLIALLRRTPLLELEAAYVETFDRQPRHALYLYEHLFGESRARGTGMVELLERYRRAGLALDCDELPDYLPVFLEYLSELPAREARRELGPVAGVLRLLARRLAEAESPYAGVLSALDRLAQGRAPRRAPESPRPMERLVQRVGYTDSGREPLLTPESMLGGGRNGRE